MCLSPNVYTIEQEAFKYVSLISSDNYENCELENLFRTTLVAIAEDNEGIGTGLGVIEFEEVGEVGEV